MPDFSCIHLTKADGVSIVRFVDDKVMDAERIARLGQELLSLADGDGDGRILVNLDNVRFLSSSAINKLIVLDRRLEAAGGELKLSNLSPEVEEVFNITQLDSVFDICKDQDEAISSFQ